LLLPLVPAFITLKDAVPSGCIKHLVWPLFFATSPYAEPSYINCSNSSSINTLHQGIIMSLSTEPSLPSSLLAVFKGPTSLEARFKDLGAEDPGANVSELARIIHSQ
jgi:hypothetical protein